jgi:glycerol kinase
VGAVLSIDAGTTGVTVLAIDEAGRVMARGYREFPQHFPKPGWVEHDPEEIWQATLAAGAQCLHEAGMDPANVACIGITNQRETTVLWERDGMRPVCRAIVWQDRRTAGICQAMKDSGQEEEVRARTGLLLDPYFSATKLVWLLAEVPDLRRRAESGKIAFGTVDSWILARLTAGRVHATDSSNASRTLLYDLRERRFHPDLLAIFGIPEEILPDILPSSGEFGRTDPETFLGINAPIGGIAGDQQAALFGQACFSPGMTKNTYGTGSFVLMNTGTAPVPSRAGLLTTVAWTIDGQTEYALEGSVFITGAAIQWLRDGLGIISQASETEPLATTVPDTGGVYFVPAFTGLGAPYWDPYARGTIVGLTRGTTRAHLLRAAVEAMAFQSRDVVEVMSAEAATPVAELRVDGGASVMDLLCQFQADQLGTVVRRPAVRETTAMGAAYLAGLSAGVWSSRQEIADHWALDRAFEPQADQASRESAYRGWKRAVERARSWAEPE